MTPFDPNERIALSLEARQWNLILVLLMDGGTLPYRVAKPIIEAITTQLERVQQVQQQDADIVPMGVKTP
jgi:hypothetical protein